MHYYNFNVADYRKDTGHLDPIEHYIYRFLMDSYYLNEEPIAIETQSVMRRLRLDSDCLDQLKNVLNDFFILGDDGWHHKRIDSEISDYHDKCSKNAINGKKGGRPKKQQLTDENKPKKTQSVNLDNPIESELKPNQEPITNNHKPITNKRDKHAALAETLGVDLALIKRIVKHRTDIKKPANTDKKIKLVINNFQACIDQGLFQTLDQAMDRLDKEPWQTVKPEYINNENRNAKNNQGSRFTSPSQQAGERIVADARNSYDPSEAF